jgi:hypothetical protein
MRHVVADIKENPHPEEVAKRPSRRTHLAYPASSIASLPSLSFIPPYASRRLG